MPLRARILAFSLALSFLVIPLPVSALSTQPSVSASSAILIDGASGRVLFEKNSSVPMKPASTTKIMTALVALEHGDLEKTVSVDPRAVGVEGSSVYLNAGERLTLSELIYCLMLASANDAAAAIAYEIAGGIPEFAELMNEKAQKLGLFSTHFENPHGIDAEGHYTTAADLARLTFFALQNEKFAEIVATKRRVIDTDLASRSLSNHNRLLLSYKGCIGVKTGFTKASGRCLVSAAKRENLTLIAVTLRAPDDWNDHRTMLDYGFEHYRAEQLCSAGQRFYEMPVVSGEKGRVFCVAGKDVFLTLARELSGITYVVECQRFLFSLPRAGTVGGRVVFYRDGKEVAQTRLLYYIM
ncbi:MAG: D-alanyl-D-alanine carboxypeptidase [Ruminococcaceae bacterium]|nr:D-alanyl-D-alanine carboxypeptidase [Oscillospiraceae bacterium]